MHPQSMHPEMSVSPPTNPLALSGKHELLGEEKLCAGLLALMVVLMFAQAAVRNVPPLGRTAFATWLAHAAEVLPSGLTWLTFLGCSAVTRRGNLLCVEALRDHFPPRWQRRLAAATWTLWAGFFALLLLLGAVAASQQRGQMTSIEWLPAWAVSLSIPFGAALVLWRTGQNLMDLARQPGPEPGTIPLRKDPPCHRES